MRAHADARAWAENWIADIEKAKWRTPRDIKNSYASASFLAGNVVIFNLNLENLCNQHVPTVSIIHTLIAAPTKVFRPCL